MPAGACRSSGIGVGPRVGSRTARGRLDDFETRRLNHDASFSITRDEIVKRNPVDTWQVLTNIAGVTIAVRDLNVVATSRRAVVQNFGNAPCFLKVIVDGVLMNPSGSFDLSRLPQPDEIHGIEVFSGPARVPPQYAGSGDGKWCGLIFVWTR